MNSVDGTLQNVKTISDKLKGAPQDIQAILYLLKDNLIESKKVLTGLKGIVGGEKDTDNNIKSGDRN